MQLGFGISTCREGIAYAPGFASPADIVRLSRVAADAGYTSLWGNQHLITQNAVAATASGVPNFYDPLMIMANVAGQVPGMQLVFGTLVAPLHHPLLLAKQLATLDQINGGNVIAGLGIGTYVEETTMLARPGSPRRHRGRTLSELIQALHALFEQESASFHGTEFEFDDVGSFPKPVGTLPIYTSGDSDLGLDRAAELADGWILASRSPAQVVVKREQMARALTKHGRAETELPLAVQTWVCLEGGGRSARSRLVESQHFRRQVTFTGKSEDELIAEFEERNILGSAAAAVEHVEALAAAGTDQVALIFLGDAVDDVVDDCEAVAAALR